MFRRALSWITGSAAWSYIKVGLLLAIVAGASWLTWSVRSAYAEREQREAVTAKVAEIQRDLDTERGLRKQYQDLADDKLDALLKSISDVRVAQSRMSAGVKVERAKDPRFYNQPLPEGGYAEWQRAKALIVTSSASSDSSASSSPP